ncbi:MAG TPA: FAD:protein FMN transferase [Clostridia bacterium]|nr:FAD:protein FMN transferase [Clostridia bacterium]
MTEKENEVMRKTPLSWRLGTLVFTALILLVFVFGCSRSSPLKRYEMHVTGPFDTVTTALIVAESEEEFAFYHDMIEGELWRYHRLYDIYNESPDGPNLKTINDRAGEAVVCQPDLRDLVAYGVDVSKETDGRVNIAMGSVLKLWHEARMTANQSPDEGYLPDGELLAEAAKHCAIGDVIVDHEVGTVTLSDPAMSLDVGAIAKGFAVERIAVKLASEGLRSGVLEAGGNVRAIGQNEVTSKPWRIGIRNPDTRSQVVLLEKVDITGQSVVTSGNYERSFVLDGKTYSHIIDPETLRPSTIHEAVTVIASDSATADFLSTTLMLMSVEDGKAFLRRFPSCEAMWVTKGDRAFTSGFALFRVTSLD